MDGGLHDVNDDSRDRDIEPDREGIAGEAAVGGEATGKREEERDEDHRKGDDGEEDVRGEELPVKRPPRAEAIEVGLAVEGEVGQVGDQEDGREEESGEHRRSMLGDAPGADVTEADEQSHGAAGVEDGI